MAAESFALTRAAHLLEYHPRCKIEQCTDEQVREWHIKSQKKKRIYYETNGRASRMSP